MTSITAEVSVDRQHGPVVTVNVDDLRVSIYTTDETGIVTTPAGQYGIEVNGSWAVFRRHIAPEVEDVLRNALTSLRAVAMHSVQTEMRKDAGVQVEQIMAALGD